MKNKDNILEVEDLGVKFSYILGNEAYFFCPLHADSRPSFCVSINTPVFFCHSCETGGHLSQLEKIISEVDKKDWAVLQTTPMSVNSSRLEDKELVLARVSLKDFWELKSAIEDPILLNRGFDPDVIQEWDIRSSPMFIFIPIRDFHNNMFGMIIRARFDNMSPRYQNMPPKMWKKSNCLLFGPNFGIIDDTIIVVEGPLDAVKLYQYGYKNVVSIMGSSLSKTQASMIRKLAGNVFVLHDNDRAGQDMILKGHEQLFPCNVFAPQDSFYKSSDPGDMEKEEIDRLFETKFRFRSVNKIRRLAVDLTR